MAEATVEILASLFFMLVTVGLDVLRRNTGLPFSLLVMLFEFVTLSLCVICMVITIQTYRQRKEDEKLIGHGVVVGYKKLKKESGMYLSPIFDCEWKGNVLKSDVPPTPDNPSGIYISKSRNNEDLEVYRGVLVRVICDGQYVEHENGYRVENARIIGEI